MTDKALVIPALLCPQCTGAQPTGLLQITESGQRTKAGQQPSKSTLKHSLAKLWSYLEDFREIGAYFSEVLKMDIFPKA